MAAFCKNCNLAMYDDSREPIENRVACPRCGSTERNYTVNAEKETLTLRELSKYVGKNRIHFIGRRDELKELSSLINTVKGVISVIGEPGVGKTALVNELLRQNDHFTPLWLTAHKIEGNEIGRELIRQIHISSPTPLIVVIDEADRLSSEDLQVQVRKAIDFGRVRNVILTTARPLSIQGITLEFKLAPLSEEDFVEWADSQNGVIYDLGDTQHTDQIVEIAKPEIIFANETLMRRLQESPHDLFRITARQLEEVIAELLNDQEFEVELTQQTHDDGVDIFAYKKLSIGRVLFIVDTKRYQRTKTIGVEMVRQLHGTLIHHNATSGMLVTTSGFSKDSRKYEEAHQFQLFLKEYADIISWLNDYKQKKKPNQFFAK
jgi:hypothetical protein